jgi:hypothetical protein
MLATDTQTPPRFTRLLAASASLLLLLAANPAAHATTTFSLNDNVGTANAGSYSPGSTFTLSVTMVTDHASPGYSLWFDTASTNASFFSISSFTLASAAFPDATSGGGPQTFNTPDRAGFLSNPNDLGATIPVGGTNAAAGSYLVENVTFLIDATTAPGTYTLQTTPVGSGGRTSGSTNPDFSFDSAASSAVYTITVVPEPSTYAMIAAGLLTLVGIQRVRRSRVARCTVA